MIIGLRGDSTKDMAIYFNNNWKSLAYRFCNDKGVWIETQYLSMSKCNELKSSLGSWFYEIKK